SWEPAGDQSQRRFERTIDVHSQPSLPPRRNSVVRSGAETAHPGEELEATIYLYNDGSAPATDVVLHLRLDPALEEVKLVEKSSRVSLDGDTADIGSIEPYAQRKVQLRARLRTPYADRSEIRVGASAHTRELGETPLGEATWRVDSHPTFAAASSRLTLE